MPSGRFFPSAFGMYRRSTAAGRYCLRAARRRALPGSARRRTARRRRSSGHRRPPRPGSASLASTPPRGRHASRCGRTARGNDVPGAAWPLPTVAVGVVALCRGLTPAGVVGTGLAGHALALTSASDMTTAGTLPSGRVVLSRPSPVLRSPRTPAAQRSISPSAYTSRLALTSGCADGSPVFRASPCTRAAPPTPPETSTRAPDSARSDVAFAVT